MTVSHSRRRLSVDKEVRDLDVGYRVIEVGGRRRKGWIEGFDGPNFQVVWDGESDRYMVGPAMVRKIPVDGHKYDARRPQ